MKIKKIANKYNALSLEIGDRFILGDRHDLIVTDIKTESSFTPDGDINHDTVVYLNNIKLDRSAYNLIYLPWNAAWQLENELNYCNNVLNEWFYDHHTNSYGDSDEVGELDFVCFHKGDCTKLYEKIEAKMKKLDFLSHAPKKNFR